MGLTITPNDQVIRPSDEEQGMRVTWAGLHSWSCQCYTGGAHLLYSAQLSTLGPVVYLHSAFVNRSATSGPAWSTELPKMPWRLVLQGFLSAGARIVTVLQTKRTFSAAYLRALQVRESLRFHLEPGRSSSPAFPIRCLMFALDNHGPNPSSCCFSFLCAHRHVRHTLYLLVARRKIRVLLTISAKMVRLGKARCERDVSSVCAERVCLAQTDVAL